MAVIVDDARVLFLFFLSISKGRFVWDFVKDEVLSM